MRNFPSSQGIPPAYDSSSSSTGTTATISMPEIGTYSEVSAYLKYSRKTLYKLVCKGEFKRGIYLGGGRFNLNKLRKCIELEGSILAGRSHNQRKPVLNADGL